MTSDFFLNKFKRNALLFFSLVAIVILSVFVTKYDVIKGITGFYEATVWAALNFYPDVKSLEKLPNILMKLGDTVLMSVAATTTSACFSFVFALLGSKTTGFNPFLSSISRGIASLSRNVPYVAWGMLLLLSFGQSALTGYIALFLVSFGFLTRAFMETIDESSHTTVEALKATGANYVLTIFRAVLPQCTPQIISWILFKVETNIRDATLLGMLTGTGIGFLFDLNYKLMKYHEASLVIVVTVITVLLIEAVSNYIRRVIL
ncbi:PhnE/PtxC family ABC transporter permease [Paenibacillus periandrae]|uniref:PhnE/PtxC family ABC transporter permease n=1 Tax=Paenibacillus periandrae TaxID=1761741 RepID=UPI001F09AC8F|nr:ABC transporter permease subunit [Paenibacillus periandrae]